MPTGTVVLLYPGEMGAAVGACLVARGLRVVWASEGRGASTRARARASQIEDRETLGRALEMADIVMSVCPPHAALELARKVAATGFNKIYVDANAISPATAREIDRVMGEAGAMFVDGGILGPPPAPGVRSRLYISGARAPDIAALFAGTGVEAIVLESPVGAASALKMCYAAWTKGATALLAAVRTLARHEDVEQALLEEWRLSQPGLPQRSEAVISSARKAWRWVGEMEEIAASFGAAGVPAGFHLAAADIYRKLQGFKDQTTPPSWTEVIAALRQTSAGKWKAGDGLAAYQQNLRGE